MAANTLGVGLPGVTSSARQRVDPGAAFDGDQGASELFGDLSRAQWNDWKTRFSPYVSVLGDIASDEAAPQRAADRSFEASGAAFDNAQRGLDMQRQGLGVALTPQQQQAEQRRQQGAEMASAVSSANETRIATQDRQQSIRGGGLGLSNIPDQILNQ
ncbi:hypothetical protein [Salinicola halophilus]|uniref:hypothetical protein n=1 Tax=Salinicola halophilus TaxID=184065 RepID=UPI000DA15EED|nr:hypothetical protein [Salinicola halophilus]